MGGFLLIRNTDGVDADELQRQYGDSIAVFDKKGLSLNQRIDAGEFLVYVFSKHQYHVDNVVLFDGGDFIVSTGTCIYNGKMGSEALREVYEDFSGRGESIRNVLGQYCLIVSKQGKLYLLNDYTGLYHVYSDDSKSVISSSLLAVARALKRKTVSPQELYEYVINGACFGHKTLISEIELVDSRKVWKLSPVLSGTPCTPSIPRLNGSGTFDEMIQVLSNDLVDYFRILKACFGSSVCSALTGGYDTRLMLALMRKVGIEPYLYVYGKEDRTIGRGAYGVRIAKSIAKDLGLTIDHGDQDEFPKLGHDEFVEQLERRYYLFDGLGHEKGIFDNGWALYTRLKRTEKARLQLNGAGGEIFRNYWALPDRTYSIGAFLKSRFDRIDYSILSNRFDRGSYFAVMQDKIKDSLGTNEDRISRWQMELLQPEWENRYWLGNNNSINNVLSYALTPLADAQFVFRACDIPLRFKHLGVFEAALIRSIDPDLAKYPSSYGYNFYDDIGWRTKTGYFARLHMPLGLKAYIRKHFYHGADERLRLGGNRFDLPFYLTKEYLDSVFPASDLAVSEYVHVDRIGDPQVLSRVLTAELVLTDVF